MERADRDTGVVGWARSSRTIWLALALAPYLALVVKHWPYLPGIHNGDYAQYLLHAKALVEGRPYGNTGYLFTPLNPLASPALQPPGWPLLLAPGVALFGTGFVYPKVLSLLAALAFLGCAGWRLGRDGER